MTAAEYAADVALVALLFTSLALGAVALRLRLLPGWDGAPARLVESVLLVAGLIVLCELLGVLHLLKPVPLLALSAAVGVAAVFVLRRGSRDDSHSARPPAPPAVEGVAAAVALLAAAVTVGNWAARISAAVAHGMPNVDTLWYHMPVAARFAQDGSFEALAQTQPDPLTPFYPANAELFHSVGIVLTGHDGLSPLMNLGWLAIAMLAAWCIGRPFGAAPLTLLGANIVLGSFLMSWSQAGDASNDIAALALFLASAALIVNAAGDRRALALAGVPAALAIGTKVSMIAPVTALLIALLVFSERHVRRRLAVSWVVLLLLLGSFWYVRNVIATGNPLPAVHVGIGELRLPEAFADRALQAPETDFKSTLAHLLGEPGASDVIRGGLNADFGPVWWAILAAVAVGLLGGIVRGRDWTWRALALTGLIAAAGWAVTPQSGSSFAVNVRHLTPALVLGLALLPLVPPFQSAVGRRACLALLAILFATAQLADNVRVPGERTVWFGATVAVAAAAAIAGMLARRSARSPLLVGLGVVLAACAVPLGFKLQRDYLRNRYSHPERSLIRGAQPDRSLLSVYAWARKIEDATIGLTGTQLQYPLMGLDVSNRVRYVHDSRANGRVVHRIRTCESWRRALAEMRPDYVVVTPVRFPFNERTVRPSEAVWTRSLPGMVEITRREGQVFVFRTRRPARSGGCKAPRGAG